MKLEERENREEKIDKRAKNQDRLEAGDWRLEFVIKYENREEKIEPRRVGGWNS